VPLVRLRDDRDDLERALRRAELLELRSKSTSSARRLPYSRTTRAGKPTRAKWRSMLMNGVMPLPPARNTSSPRSQSGSKTKLPAGPLASTSHPGWTSANRYGEANPSVLTLSVRSSESPPGADAML